MKILLLGANGQLGRTFLQHGGLASRGSLVAASRDGQLIDGGNAVIGNLEDAHALRALLDAQRPDIIVNTAAYTAVDRAEQEEDLATRVNGDAVQEIATWAASHGALFVHYSTDYVFSGDATSPYGENTGTSPAGAYGRSKLAGETALARSGAMHFNFRTAWVYSPVGHNFLLTMLRLGGERPELRVVADQIGSPTDTVLIVEGTLAAVDRWIASSHEEKAALSGTYHLTSSGQTSWHGFASAILEGADHRKLIASAPVVTPIGTHEFPTPARRPAYSVLDNSRFSSTFGHALTDWQTGLNRTLDALSHASD